MEETLFKVTALRYFASVLILLAICFGEVFAERFIPKKALAFRISDLYGCKIISIPKDSVIPYRLREDCRKATVPNFEGSNSWHDYYSSIEISLGSALKITLRSLSKSLGIWTTQLTKGKDIHIVLYHDPLANAGIGEYEDYILIGINDGLVELIENTASALEMASTSPNLKGINFADWLELMRTPRGESESKIISAGPDKDIADNNVLYPPTWFWSTRIKSSILYQFILGHELAHIYRGDLEGPYVVSLNREMSCDILSFDAFFTNNDQQQAISFVLPFLVSLWYYESYWENEIRESGRIVMTNLHPDLFARNWNKRAKKLLDRWQDIFGDNRNSRTAKSIYTGILFGLRSPFNSSAIDGSAEKKIITLLKGVTFHRPPKDAEVDYSLVVLNGDAYNSIEVVVEVQSRVFSRNESITVSSRAPKDHKDRWYQVVDNKSFNVTVPPKGIKVFSGTLPWVGNKAVYPGVAQRVVAANYSD